MNCRVIDHGHYLEVFVTLSDRNLRALEASREGIARETKMDDRLVIVHVRSELDEVHYHSEDREEKRRGEAGALHRLGEGIENGDTIKIEIPYEA